MTEIDGAESITDGMIASAADITVSTVVIPFAQFVPLIKDVADILKRIVDLYSTAQHNKKITKLLMERVAAAHSAISILREDDLYTSKHYYNLQRLVQVLQKMKNYADVITQYNKVQKFLGAQTIESSFNNLCKEYELSIQLLNLTLMVDFRVNAEKERKILQDDLKELTKFQEALAESITDANKKMDRIEAATNNLAVDKECVRHSSPEMLRRGMTGEMLTALQDIFHSYDAESPASRPVSIKKRVPVRKDTALFNWGSFNYLTIDKAVEEHKKDNSVQFLPPSTIHW
ncbi:1226_t:CDS:2 [Rhizophagus irregularis]|nr:1226_t:CDS:2 [Rhizophagus irregularis]